MGISLDAIIMIIVSALSSSVLVSLVNRKIEQRKADSSIELNKATTNETFVRADNDTIASLIHVNNLYSTRVEALDVKVAELERKESTRKTIEVDLEIRVKRLEAELAISVKSVEDRDMTIANLEKALAECRKSFMEYHYS